MFTFDAYWQVKTKHIELLRTKNQRDKRDAKFAAHIEVDTALMSKAEKGERNLNREQVIKLAKLFKTPEEELISLWLCDKVIDVVGDDAMAGQGIKKALNKIRN